MNPNLRRRLEKALAGSGPASSDYDLNPDVELPKSRRLRSAAVLIAIREVGVEPTVLLTKRAPTLKHHPGQIAFPGGKVDEDDETVVATALREAHEEIGLPHHAVQVIGRASLPRNCHGALKSRLSWQWSKGRLIRFPNVARSRRFLRLRYLT